MLRKVLQAGSAREIGKWSIRYKGADIFLGVCCVCDGCYSLGYLKIDSCHCSMTSQLHSAATMQLVAAQAVYGHVHCS